MITGRGTEMVEKATIAAKTAALGGSAISAPVWFQELYLIFDPVVAKLTMLAGLVFVVLKCVSEYKKGKYYDRRQRKRPE